MMSGLLDVSETGLVPLFALPEACLLPGESLPFLIFEPRYRTMLMDALMGERLIALARLQPGYESEYAGNPPVYPCMGVGEIVMHRWAMDGTAEIILRGVARTRLAEVVKPLPYRLGRLVDLPEVPGEETVRLRHATSIRALLDPLAAEFDALGCDLDRLLQSTDMPWRIALLLDLSAPVKQSLLEADAHSERLGIIAHELEDPEQRDRVRALLKAIDRQRERDERGPPDLEAEAGL